MDKYERFNEGLKELLRNQALGTAKEIFKKLDKIFTKFNRKFPYSLMEDYEKIKSKYLEGKK